MDRETLGNPEAMVALNHLLKWVFSITTGIVGIGSIVFITLKREKLIHKDSLWSAPHFTGATIAQFLYVAAQAGIFSFFINYMVEEVPAIAESMKSSWFIGGGEGSILRNGAYFITEKGATSLMSYMAFPLFLIGRFTGSFILRVTKAHNMLGLYSFINAHFDVSHCSQIRLDISCGRIPQLFLYVYYVSNHFLVGLFGDWEKNQSWPLRS